jgi:hypothetical protein
MTKRLLIVGWGLYFLCVALLLGFPKHLVRHSTLVAVLAFGLGLIFTSVACILVLAFRRIYSRGQKQTELRQTGAARVAQWSLLALWLLCIAALLVASFFPRATWIPSPEVLFVLVIVVVLLSMVYASYLFLHRFLRRPH